MCFFRSVCSLLHLRPIGKPVRDLTSQPDQVHRSHQILLGCQKASSLDEVVLVSQSQSQLEEAMDASE